MTDQIVTSIVTVLTAIIGVAILSVLVGSPNTAKVITAGGSAFSSILGAALSPVNSSGLGNIANTITGSAANFGG